MFIEKYLDEIYSMILFSNYDVSYLETLDEVNFTNVYNVLKTYEIDFISDIIVNYIEIFELNYKAVEKAFEEIFSLFGQNFIKECSNNLTLLDKVIELASKYDI